MPRWPKRKRRRPSSANRWWILTDVRDGAYHFIRPDGEGGVTACNQKLYKATPRFYNPYHTRYMRLRKRCKICVQSLEKRMANLTRGFR